MHEITLAEALKFNRNRTPADHDKIKKLVELAQVTRFTIDPDSKSYMDRTGVRCWKADGKDGGFIADGRFYLTTSDITAAEACFELVTTPEGGKAVLFSNARGAQRTSTTKVDSQPTCPVCHLQMSVNGCDEHGRPFPSEASRV